MSGNIGAIDYLDRFRKESIFARSVFKAWSIVGFLLIHIPLALLMKQLPALATLHAVGTVIVGLCFLKSDRKPERIAYVGAYIVGAEVLWRLTKAQIFWEYGKYSVAALFIIAIIRRQQFKGPLLPALYLGLLLPSTIFTVSVMSSSEAHRAISFNLSGPFALMICCLYFSRQTMTREQLRHLFLALVAPILGVAFITLIGTLEAVDINFAGGSNKVTSGGWGPNQVSSALGLGSIIAIFLLIDSKVSNSLRVLLLCIAVFLGIQSALTFSRTGVYGIIICGGIAALFSVMHRGARIKLVFAIGLIIVLLLIFLPRVDTFTGGALSARFQDSNPTGRALIAFADLDIWYENPFFGVGPGISTGLHSQTFRRIVAHTEYSRLLAEHGIFGLFALILLVVMSLRNIRRAGTVVGKGLVIAMVLWSMLYMLSNAMRLVAPAFIFGLAYVALLSKEKIPLEMARTIIKLLILKFSETKIIVN